MRTENKYIRNRNFRAKHWKRARSLTNPYEHTHGAWCYTTEESIQSHFESIDKQARAIENGSHTYYNHASADFRRQINKKRKAQERVAMPKIRNGDYDVEVPRFKRDANWLWV